MNPSGQKLSGNKAQIDDGSPCTLIDESEGWLALPSKVGDFLRLNQNRSSIPKYFSNTFKFRLLESIPDLTRKQMD